MSTMQKMTPELIAKACNGKLFCAVEDRQLEITGAVIDSRKVEYHNLFFAVRGEKTDGHNYINQVYEKGALLVVCEEAPEEKDTNKNYILVENSLTALKQIAEYYRTCIQATVIGITGSVGKTTTKEFIAAVLSQKFNVLKTEGNFNNEIGLPLTVLRIRKEHEVAVLEMGINHFGEMRRLSKIAKPDIVVITNIGQCHLEFLETREGILKAKSEIFEFMNPLGTICLNGDDDCLATVQDVNQCKMMRFGLENKHQVYAEQIRQRGLLGSSARIVTKEETFEVSIPLSGTHMVYNALAATAVGKALGLSHKEIADGITQVKALGGRNNIIQTSKYIIIDDCYNANPVSMKAAIDLLSISDCRKVAILGDMGELGENVTALHREIGYYLIQKEIDVAICVGEYAHDIYKAAIEKANELKLATKCYFYNETEEMLLHLEKILQTGDSILVKASHFMEFDKIVEKLEETDFTNS